MAIVDQRPLVVWTSQRTGGTNLAYALFSRSRWPQVGHEPFNLDRIFGHITKQWLENQDEVLLLESIRKVCQRGVLIKQCVEVVPWEVSRALAEATLESDYRQLFLYRKNAVARLLSVHFSQTNAVWEPGTARKKESDGELSLETPLPVKKLVNMEARAVGRLSEIWQLLCRRGAGPTALAYEDIYESDDPENASRLLQPIVIGLGLASGESEAAALVRMIVRDGHQGTRHMYSKFPGLDRLTEAAQKVPRFVPL